MVTPRVWQACQVTPDQARTVLGVPGDVSPEALRAAYRKLMRTTHPDVAGDAETLHAARIIEAYDVLRAVTDTAPARPAAAAAEVQEDTLSVRSISPAVFEQFRAAADVVGDVTYVDPSCGILETLVTWPGWPPSSLVLALEPRGGDTVVQCTLESLDGWPGPPIAGVVDALRRAMGVDLET